MIRSRTAPTRMYCGRGSARQATQLRSQPAAGAAELFVPWGRSGSPHAAASSAGQGSRSACDMHITFRGCHLRCDTDVGSSGLLGAALYAVW